MSIRSLTRASAHAYILKSDPDVFPVSLCDAREYLKVADTSQDGLISQLIAAATLYGEKLTRRDFIQKQYSTFREPCDFLNLECIELRRSQLALIDRFEYRKDGVLTPVDPLIFYTTKEADFSRICLVDGEFWPSDVDDRFQAIEIDFTAGFSGESDGIPADIKTAIMAHVAMLYENRGDCGSGGDKGLFASIPAQSATIYKAYKIHDIRTGYR